MATKPLVSLMIAAYERPTQLTLLLAALQVQTMQHWEALVLDESPVGVNAPVVEGLARFRADPRIRYVRCPHGNDWGQTSKLIAAQRKARGQWFMFPNDDAYYVPTALHQFTHTALGWNLDLVYCDWLYDGMGYQAWPVKPQTGHIDVGGFMVKASVFKQAAADGLWRTGVQTGDGEFIEKLVSSGVKHGRAPGVLYVKN